MESVLTDGRMFRSNAGKRVLFSVSSAEAIFLPIAPDLVLVPLVLAEHRRKMSLVFLAI